MNYLMDLADDWLEFEGASMIIPLDSESFDRALEQSRRAGRESQQWPIYLQWLALLSFERWLQLRMPEVRVEREGCSLLQAGCAAAIAAVCNLTVGSFRVCLVPTLCLADETATVPRAAIDLPEFAAQFYIVIGIKEAAEMSTIVGWLRYDQLRQHRRQLHPEIDWTYTVPAFWFNRESDALLLELQCLDPGAIPLPAIPPDRRASLSQMKAELAEILPHLQSRSWWRQLSWEQGAAVLASPPLLNWLHRAVEGNQTMRLNTFGDLLQLLTQAAINVGCWFQFPLEDTLQEQSWQLLPAISLMRLGRGIRFEHLEAMLRELERLTGMEIPASARTAFQDFSFPRDRAPDEEAVLVTLPPLLRLYAVTWLLPASQEWVLLLILGAPPDQPPQYGVKLRLSDLSGVLVEEGLQPGSHQDYLFVQVKGTMEEAFLATVTSADGKGQVSRLFECRSECRSEEDP